jgi:hypothetical protein
MPLWPFGRRAPRLSSPPNDNPPDARCSFCGAPRKHVGPMVEGPNRVFICVECVRLAHQIAELNRMQPENMDPADSSVRRGAHMHIRCYYFLRQGEDGQWRATGQYPSGAYGVGPSPKDAVRDLQSRLLSATAEAFALGTPIGDHFTNHADPSLR